MLICNTMQAQNDIKSKIECADREGDTELVRSLLGELRASDSPAVILVKALLDATDEEKVVLLTKLRHHQIDVSALKIILQSSRNSNIGCEKVRV